MAIPLKYDRNPSGVPTGTGQKIFRTPRTIALDHGASPEGFERIEYDTVQGTPPGMKGAGSRYADAADQVLPENSPSQTTPGAQVAPFKLGG